MGKTQTSPSAPVDGKKLLREIKKFQRESLAGAYYAPFNMNSKNYMHIPPETEAWFDRLGELLVSSMQLAKQKEHQQATDCFGLLFELIEAMESGEEIVFADEIGSWMIPGDEKRYIAAYLKSLAATATPEAFAAVAVPLLRRDSHQSFTGQVYPSAIRVATQEQRACLEAEVERQRIQTERTA
jgi:hypothetical protein